MNETGFDRETNSWQIVVETYTWHVSVVNGWYDMFICFTVLLSRCLKVLLNATYRLVVEQNRCLLSPPTPPFFFFFGGGGGQLMTASDTLSLADMLRTLLNRRCRISKQPQIASGLCHWWFEVLKSLTKVPLAGTKSWNITPPVAWKRETSKENNSFSNFKFWSQAVDIDIYLTLGTVHLEMFNGI